MSQLTKALHFLGQAQDELSKIRTSTTQDAQALGHALAYIDLAGFRINTEIKSQQADIPVEHGKVAVGR